MQSNDSDHFFETDAAQAQKERKSAKAGNKHGDPLLMKSKILAVCVDPSDPLNTIFIAESAGYVRRVQLQSSTPKATYRGPRAPATCLTVGGHNQGTVFAGSWDKDIWSWDIESTQAMRRFSGHTDFVKAIICANISGKDVLISGGADRKMLVWDIETGQRLHTLQDPTTTMLAIQHLAMDPVLTTKDALVLASASSDPHIRRWKITLTDSEQLPVSSHDRSDAERMTIEEHETSIYRLLFDATSEDGDLWTASADGTSKCLARSRGFVTEDVFHHTDYVRAVLVTDQWVVTAGRDENVKVWDRASGQLYCTLEGHYEEVTDMVLMRNSAGQPDRVCSVSIDCTIRIWPLNKSELDDAVKKIEEAKTPQEETEEPETGDNLLTAEEQAELAELMDD